MLAVVTGGSGFIGSHLVDTLLERGFTVRCLVRPTSNLRWLDDKNVELIETQLNDQEALNKACAGASYIIHCAGNIAARSLEDYIRDNKGATEHLLRAALTTASSLKRFVYLSSMSACGPAASLDKPLHGDSPCAPITSYGISKLEGEKVVLSAREKIPVTIIRPPAVYGERDEATLSFFKMIKQHFAPLMGFSEKWISMVHVSDLVRGIVDAMLSENTKSNVYFISEGKDYNWKQISDLTSGVMKSFIIKAKMPHFVVLGVAGITGFLSRFSAKPAVFNYEKGIDFIQPFWICSIEEAQRDFQFEPRVPLKEGFERTIAWYTAQGWL